MNEGVNVTHPEPGMTGVGSKALSLVPPVDGACALADSGPDSGVGPGVGVGVARFLDVALAVQDTFDQEERNRLVFDGLVLDITDGIEDVEAVVRLTGVAVIAATALAKVLDERDDARRVMRRLQEGTS